MLAIDTIDEDAQQPRREFDQQALDDLAASIRERGVRQPVWRACTRSTKAAGC